MTILCDVYKSLNKSDYYLFVKREQGLTRVPKALLSQLGKLELAMSITLTPNRPMAATSAKDVMIALAENGYHLQIPRQSENYMQGVKNLNEKLY
jgi:hypothetical protein